MPVGLVVRLSIEELPVTQRTVPLYLIGHDPEPYRRRLWITLTNNSKQGISIVLGHLLHGEVSIGDDVVQEVTDPRGRTQECDAGAKSMWGDFPPAYLPLEPGASYKVPLNAFVPHLMEESDEAPKEPCQIVAVYRGGYRRYLDPGGNSELVWDRVRSNAVTIWLRKARYRGEHGEPERKYRDMWNEGEYRGE